ncbi:MAG: AzlD domain-containing protein [Clostridia bacterium]|nr:AzlD domain-containing protein [Clostridia bacterium]
MVYYLLAVLVMAVVTYIPRVLPLSLFRRPVKSRFIKSFLEYMPVAVLAAMTFPSILTSTDTPWSALIGMAVALVASFVGMNLLPVALLSSASVLITECIMFGWTW